MSWGLRAAVLGALIAAPEALADDVSFVVGTNENAAAFGIDEQTLVQQLREATGEDLHVIDQGAFLGAMANATGLAGRGMGVDYATNPEKFVLGASFGPAVYQNTSLGNEEEGLPEGGFASQASVMLGLNLGVFGGEGMAERVVLYGHFLSVAMPAVGEFEGHASQGGAHVQLELVPGAGVGVAEFGGIDVTTGLEVTRYRLGLSEQLAVETGADLATIVWRTSGSYEITARAVTVPIEVSTNARLLFLTLFGGLALDLSPTVAADSEGALMGNLIATSDLTPDETHIGDADLTIHARGTGLPVTPRVFVGPQLNVFVVRAYLQFNAGLLGGYGLHAGGRIAL